MPNPDFNRLTDYLEQEANNNPGVTLMPASIIREYLGGPITDKRRKEIVNDCAKRGVIAHMLADRSFAVLKISEAETFSERKEALVSRYLRRYPRDENLSLEGRINFAITAIKRLRRIKSKGKIVAQGRYYISRKAFKRLFGSNPRRNTKDTLTKACQVRGVIFIPCNHGFLVEKEANI